MPGTVSSTLQDNILIVCVDNPPVNALSLAVRNGLFEAIEAADENPAVKAVVIYGKDRMFIAGADMREFDKTRLPKILPDVCHRIEACSKPVVAALHKVAAGGGVEIALGAHYRVALPGTRLSMPEVNIGLMPGAGGTQRLPRLIGIEKSLDLILSGKPMPAQQALEAGLIDEIADTDDALEAGLAMARRILDQGLPPRRASECKQFGDRDLARQALNKTRGKLQQKSKNLFSPFRIVDSVENAMNLSFAEGMAREREMFLACLDSPQREGLVHAFFTDREVTKSPETREHEAREINSIGVIGGGTMGAGICVAALDAGLRVVMIERDTDALDAGRSRVDKVYQRNVSKGRMTEEQKQTLLQDNFDGSTEYTALSDCDLIIEAVFEDMGIKEQVFAAIDKVAKAGAILATNTSYLDINQIAAATRRPQDVIGLHFFSPANIMKLLEIVVADKTAGDVVASGFALAKRLRKVPVRAGVCDGFIGNRILARYRQAADYMMEDGASPYQIDAAVRAFGYPMGPYQVTDLAGGDIGWANRKRQAPTRDPNARYVEIGDRICERGWFGQKTGRGYYLYEKGSRSGTPDPEVEAIIETERQRAGVTPREFSSEEITRRYLAAMINEGAKVVEDGIALRPLDVDAALLYGYGFPRWRGGPMKYADMQGLDNILSDIREFEKEDPLFWKPAALLVELVESGRNFASLNQ